MVREAVVTLSDADKARVASAIEAAENRTSGEIFCVVARQSADFSWIGLVYGACLALLVPVIMLLFGLDPLELARALYADWHVADDAGAEADAGRGLLLIVAIQGLILVGCSVLGLLAPVRSGLTPGALKRQAVHRAALDQFMAHGIHLTEARTGVLVYVSLSEHQAEIIADAGIYAKVDKAVWRDAIGALLSRVRQGELATGLVDAIGQAGTVLSAHFPPSDDDQDEIPNRVVLL
jgi:putative membrane protein